MLPRSLAPVAISPARSSFCKSGLRDQVTDFSVASQLAQGRVLACPQPAV